MTFHRFLTPVVGVGAVTLDTKLPWSTKYVAHSASRYVSSISIMGKTGAPVFSSMFLQGQGGEEDARSRASSIVERRVKSTPAPLAGATDVFGTLDAGDSDSDDHAANDTGHHAATAKIAPDPATLGAYSKSESALKRRGGVAIAQETGILSEQAREASSDAATREGEGGGEGERKEGGPKEHLVGEEAPEKDIVEVMGQEDEGAGVFGAILHEPGM